MSYSAPPGGPGPAGPYGAPGQQPIAPHGAPPQQPGWYPPGPPPPPTGDPGGGKGLKAAVIGLSVLALVAVLGVGGFALYNEVGGGSLPLAEGSGEDTEQVVSQEDIATLLDGRTQALKSGDEDAYLAPFVGQAKEEQRKLFRNLRKVPFAESKYMVLKQTGGSDEYGSDVKVALDIAFVHQIKGVDVRPVSEWYRWTVERESASAEPRITGVGGSPSAYGLASAVYYPAPWDLYEDMYVKRNAHTVTIAAKKNAAAAGRYAPIIEQAAKADVELWKSKAPEVPDIPSGFLVVIEPDRKTYTKLYNNGGRDVGWDAGQSVPMPAFNAGYGGGTEDALEYGGARIKLDASTSRFISSTWQRGVAEISRHEIAHALVQPLDDGSYGYDEKTSIRAWVVEGFAEYVAYRFDRGLGKDRVRRDLSGEDFDGKLPEQDFEGSLNPIGMNYALSYLAVQFIADKGGEEAAFEFVVAHYKKPTEFEQQLRKAVGMGESEFEAAWAQYVRSNS
ncbi:hypothetical protein ABZX98_01045 [Streptomyces sp. NPDC002992]|uniref:hypothetical protein n=1 Tax=Streptomyces sp. NPDC002992 TaxID=3154273 RepID=UPI0033BA2E54